MYRTYKSLNILCNMHDSIRMFCMSTYNHYSQTHMIKCTQIRAKTHLVDHMLHFAVHAKTRPLRL